MRGVDLASVLCKLVLILVLCDWFCCYFIGSRGGGTARGARGGKATTSRSRKKKDESEEVEDDSMSVEENISSKIKAKRAAAKVSDEEDAAPVKAEPTSIKRTTGTKGTGTRVLPPSLTKATPRYTACNTL